LVTTVYDAVFSDANDEAVSAAFESPRDPRQVKNPPWVANRTHHPPSPFEAKRKKRGGFNLNGSAAEEEDES
jgi:hypothetical protein